MTVAAALTIAGLATVLVAIGFVGAGMVARHRAQNAADLGAMAAAAGHVWGQERPCALAQVIVEAQEGGPRVVRCEVDGPDLLVEVAVRVRLGPWGVRAAVGRARAGPVTAGG